MGIEPTVDDSGRRPLPLTVWQTTTLRGFYRGAVPDRIGGIRAEYPLFQGLNVVLIAICGSLALVRQAKVLLRD
jgi:hypothetical protein